MGNNNLLATACEVPKANIKHKLHVVKPAHQNSQLHTDRQQVWNVLRIHNKANKRLIMTTTSVKSGLIYRYLLQLWSRWRDIVCRCWLFLGPRQHFVT